MDPHLPEEDLHESDQPAERESEVRNHPLHLVEFGQMCSVHAFVSEHPVNREVARRAGVSRQLVEHVGRNSRGVGTEHQSERFFIFEWVAVAYRAVFALLVNLFDVIPIASIVLLGRALRIGGGTGAVGQSLRSHRVGPGFVGPRGVGDVEGVLEVAGRMLLRNEEGVEIPETGLDVSADNSVIGH